MNQRIVSQLDESGFFAGPVIADESPLEPGVFLLPAGAIDKAPPANIEPGKRYRPWGAGWRGEAVPQPEPEPEVPQLSPAELRRQEIMARLAEIDAASARPLRDVVGALVAGQMAPEFAAGKLAALEAEAATLRAELAGLA